ncbi:hypothetical protein [Halalkalicoccus jeotgali]|uniref:DUF7969 domain-containing protein n=1 Tax=Halalkalicoccus jeotgali (strain DSM 18796 / CECT 7217 / JCM 14584 / KCTC 4019 / B3) TaxID=795797 RepID=D8J293_HALJB|nr:hypothetical protein [Halalkalicoccus jeotgali]ADJ14850.1 hypothetical protein HacjB3_07325 [Halalkalicoccus jeotgali B3]ELY39432.1 hypothetical protein C497_05732 [Halalkalicoccus jeotgali B3]
MVEVTYYCPRCGALAGLERDAYLADKSVTPYPLEGWEYATPGEDYEDAEGVRFVCGSGESPALSFRPPEDGEGSSEDVGCGEPFYLSFVRFEAGREIEPRPPDEYVEIGAGIGPRGLRGPRGPDGRS